MSLQYERMLALHYKLFTEKLPSGHSVDRVTRPESSWADSKGNAPEPESTNSIKPFRKANSEWADSTVPSPAPETKPSTMPSTMPSREHNILRSKIKKGFNSFKEKGIVPATRNKVNTTVLNKLKGNTAFLTKLKANPLFSHMLNKTSLERDGDVVKYALNSAVGAAAARTRGKVAAEVENTPAPKKEELPDISQFATKKPNKILSSALLSSAVHPSLHGTKLAADLIHVRDKFGTNDKELKTLAKKALLRTATNEEYEKIGHRLYNLHADPKRVGIPSLLKGSGIPKESHSHYREHARQIAMDYNWKHINNKLDLDDVVKSGIEKIFGNENNAHSNPDGSKAKFTNYKDADSHLRAAHNFFGKSAETRHDKYGISKDMHAAFWQKLKKHIQKEMSGAGASVKLTESGLGSLTNHDLEQSMLRLARGEDNRANIEKDKVAEGINDPSYYANPHTAPAWVKAKGNNKWVRRDNAHAWQFKRESYDEVYEAALRYGLFEKVKNYISPSSEKRPLYVPPPTEENKNVISLEDSGGAKHGDEHGINMWTGNEDTNATPFATVHNRRKEYDGILHNATLNGRKGINPYNYKAAHIEQAAVAKALEDMAGGSFPVSHKKVADHIDMVRELMKTEQGKELLGNHLSKYTELASKLPEKYPFQGEALLLRSSAKGQRTHNNDVTKLAEAVKPIVRIANSKLSQKNRKIAEAAGNDYYSTDLLPPDKNQPSDNNFKWPDRSFGWGKQPGEGVQGDTSEEIPDFDLPEITATTPSGLKGKGTIDKIESMQSPEEMLAAAEQRLATPKQTSKVPLAKKKSGGQFKSLLKNYGVESTPKEEVKDTSEKIPLVKGKVKKLPPIRQFRLSEEDCFNDEQLMKYARALHYGDLEETVEQHARAGAGGLIVNYGDVSGKFHPGGTFVETLGSDNAPTNKKPKKNSKRKALRLKIKRWIANKGFSSFN